MRPRGLVRLAGLLVVAACTPRSAEPPAAQPSASAALDASAASLGWRANPELERAIEGLGFRKGAAKNLSDAALLALGGQTFLIVVSDEGHTFGVTTLGANPKSRLYDLAALPRGTLAIELPEPGSDVEIDLEAVTAAGDRVFLVGSASLKRKKPKKGDYGSERISEIVPASGAGANYSNYVYELRARPGEQGLPEFELAGARDARKLLLELPPVAVFKDVPSKDNGLDVEGAAVHGGFFYFGLRGPVLRGRALVVRTRLDFTEPEMFTLDLHGLGVRALSAAGAPPDAALYILAGATLPRQDHFELFRFTAPAARPADVRTSDLEFLTSVPSRADQSPEALFPLGNDWCVLSDGVIGGAPRCHAPF